MSGSSDPSTETTSKRQRGIRLYFAIPFFLVACVFSLLAITDFAAASRMSNPDSTAASEVRENAKLWGLGATASTVLGLVIGFVRYRPMTKDDIF